MYLRDFKGVWIPKEIWLNKELSIVEKALIAEIDSLDTEEKGCYASNEYLASFVNLSEGRCANVISSLKKRGFIYQSFFDGRQRGLRVSNLSKSESRVHENVKAEITETLSQSSQKRETYNILENKIINTNTSFEKSNEITIDDFFSRFSKEQIDDFFKRISKEPPPVAADLPQENDLFSDWWKIWKKKVGKEKVKKKFLSLKKPEQLEVIEHTKAYMEVITDEKYVCDPHKYLSSKFYREPDFIKSRDFRNKSNQSKVSIVVSRDDDDQSL